MNFEEVYNSYFGRIYSYIRARGLNETAADDICSDVWETVFKKQNAYDEAKGNIEQWLFSIARNKANGYFRLYYIRNIFSLTDKEDVLPSGESVNEELDKQEDVKQLNAALSSLNAKERDLISLKFFSSMTNREISAVSSLSESNVGTILNRAMQKVRTILEDL